MDIRLHLLESFQARAADGQLLKVCAYERMAPDASLQDGGEHWEPTGVIEYRLADGRLVDAGKDGSLRIAGSNVQLTPVEARPDGARAADAASAHR